MGFLKIKHLELTDFMNIHSASLSFSSLNYIFGEPASGKSALFEAMALAFGLDKRAGSFGEYVKQGADKAEVRLDSALYDDENASINLTLNKRDSGSSCDRALTWKGATYKNSKATELLDSMKVPYYAKIAFQMQQAEDIVDQTPASRLEYIKQLFDFDYTTQKQEVQNLKAALTESQRNFVAKKQADELLITNVSAQLAAIPASDDLPFSDEEADRFRAQIDANSKAIVDGTKVKALRENVKRKLETVEALSRVSSVGRAVSVLGAEEEAVWAPRLKEAKGAAEEASRKVLTLKGRRSALVRPKGGETCPVCGQQIPLDTDAVARWEKSVKEAEEEISAAEEEKKKAEEILSAIERDPARAELSRAFAHAKELLSLEQGALRRLPALSSNETKESLTAQLVTLGGVETPDAEALLRENAALQAKIDEQRKAKETLAKRKALEEQIATLHEDVKRLETELSKDVGMGAVYDEAYDILNKLLPQYRTKVFCDASKKDLNDFVHLIFKNYEVEVDVSKRGGCNLLYTKDRSVLNEKRNAWLDVKMSSGFERAVLTTAFKSMLARFHGLDLFIGDEIDKASSDTDSCKLYSALLESKQFNQVFIISHKKALGQFLRDEYGGEGIATFVEAKGDGTFGYSDA